MLMLALSTADLHRHEQQQEFAAAGAPPPWHNFGISSCSEIFFQEGPMPFARSSSGQRSQSRGPPRGWAFSLKRGPNCPGAEKAAQKTGRRSASPDTRRAAQVVSDNPFTLLPRPRCRRSWSNLALPGTRRVWQSHTPVTFPGSPGLGLNKIARRWNGAGQEQPANRPTVLTKPFLVAGSEL
jgi:hypothetical protein